MFLPYFSKDRGPPRIRMQQMGVKRKRFYKIVAANQRDPRDGKHMEVLGSYVPKPRTGVREIRLRFSRMKFWLGVGAELNTGMQQILAWSGLIPIMPPRFGWRTKGQYNLLQQIMEQQAEIREKKLNEYFKTAYLQTLRVKEKQKEGNNDNAAEREHIGQEGNKMEEGEEKEVLSRTDMTKVHLIIK
eukprot:GHVS01025157.1.p1 GENE.GHVS01025157.1~~GHVS01025157.1.p1  ORF type:complete len:187 (+),score=28.95 GHVS01025157.1:141-701(+)